MKLPRHHSQRGSLVLVVLCLLAVLGIALAGYLAVSNQSMKLSNRAYAADVSRHLAEMGLERAMRSFSFNTFSSWTLSGNLATETLTSSSNPHLPVSYGTSGIVPSVNIRVYNYRTANKGIIWSPQTTYAVNDYVYYRGVWYLCTSAPTAGQAPAPSNTAWVSAPTPWSASTTYQPGNIAMAGGNAYRCIVANINQTPPNTTYWTSYGASAWNAASAYALNDVVLSGGLAYRCIAASTNNSPPNTTYWLSAPVIYSEGVASLPDDASTTIKTQLRALVSPAALFPNALGAANLVTLSGTGYVDSYNSTLTSAWNSSTTYAPGDVVRSGSTYYRCVATSNNNAPPNATYWLTAPLGYSATIAGGNTSGTAVQISAGAVMGGYIAAPSTTSSPYAPQVSLNASASLKNPDGTVTSPHATATNVDLTRVSRSPYIPQFDIQSVSGAVNLPNGTSFLPDGSYTLGTAGASTPSIYNISRTYTQTGAYYSGLYLADSGDTLTINGPVILNITGTYFGMGSGQIIVSTTGSLEIYFSNSTQMYLGIGAGGGITNNTNDPAKVFIASNHPTNTLNYHYLQTPIPFLGTIYMPNAYLTVSTSAAVYGALSAQNINFTATTNMHYDTTVRTAGKIGSFVDGPYIVTELRELTDPTEKVVLP